MSRFVLLALALGIANSCNPTAPTASFSAPTNACPDHPCNAYNQPGAPPACNGGVCLVEAQLGALVLVVSLAEDSHFAPDRTFAGTFADLLSSSASGPDCIPGTCANLPEQGVPLGAYAVMPHEAQELDYALNPPPPWGVPTTLPVVVTYRPLWPLNVSSAQDAVAVGLPLELVQTTSIPNPGLPLFPGPALGPGLQFQTYLQHGFYQRTVAPQPPFDRVFPPDVRVIEVSAESRPTFEYDQLSVDVTTSAQGPEIPTYDLTRADGLDGWSALLRDRTTKRPISNIVPLSGTTVQGVVLATNHSPPDLDALSGAELILSPPPEVAIPTGIFDPTGNYLPRQETYLPLPAPATVQGTVARLDGTPVDADLVFEATGINVSGVGFPLFPAGTNFEYLGHASARRNEQGGSSYSVMLPRGQYRVTARPLDAIDSEGGAEAAPDGSSAVTVIDSFVVPPDTEPAAIPIVVQPQQLIQGTASVSDGRPLSMATIDALPVQCASSRATSPSCLPRAGHPTTTNEDGTFSIFLDQGGYTLRARPVDGTRLPWASKAIIVGPTPASVPPALKIPAPIYAGLTLRDPQNNPIVRAVVRVFQTSPPASTVTVLAGAAPPPAVEIGRAITDATGHYDMYIGAATQ